MEPEDRVLEMKRLETIADKSRTKQAAGGIAGQLHMNEGGRIGFHRGSLRHQKEHDYQSLEDKGNFMRYLLLSGDRAKAYGQSPEGGTGPYSWPKIDPDKRMDYSQRQDALETYMKERFMYGEHKRPNVFKQILSDMKNLYEHGNIKGHKKDKKKDNKKADGGVASVLPKGREADYRGGGVIPVGSRERADDVPARLSKNEFVMTADAVRAAGGGSINKGAKRMYNLMHNLEARV